MWRIEVYFKETKYNKAICLQKDFALITQARDFAEQAKSLGLGVICFDVSFKQLSIEDLVVD